jgi:hypothetical protein
MLVLQEKGDARLEVLQRESFEDGGSGGWSVVA